MKSEIRDRINAVILKGDRLTIEEIGEIIERVAGKIRMYGFKSSRGYLITIEACNERCELIVEGLQRYRIISVQG